MLKGFRDFILRGNVVDLAVAFIIGVAFSGVVTAFAEGVIGGLLATIGGVPDFGEARIPGTEIVWGTTVTALINFLIVASVVYFLIVAPMNRFNALRKRTQAEEKVAPSEEVQLLTEIRDALRARRSDA